MSETVDEQVISSNDVELLPPEQDPTALADKQWEIEKKWSVWKVVLTGDEVDYVGRAGVNDGQPYRGTARCTVQLRALNAERAKAKAFSDNPEYHTVESCEEVDSG